MIPLFAMVLPVLILFCGLALDVSFLEGRSITMQAAADAAATSAVIESDRSSNWAAVGQQTAAINGYTNGVNGTVVTVTRQPASGTYAGRYDALAVAISMPAPTMFLQYLYPTRPVAVKAVALIPPCLYLTGSNSSTAILLQSTQVHIQCPAYINGASVIDGFANLYTGGNNLTNGSTVNGSMWPSPTMNTPPIVDPLASLTQPALGNCTYNNFSVNGGSTSLNPGVYCGGMTLKNATVTLAPGLYVIAGGAHWTTTTVTGTGVTLFFTSQTPSSGGYGQFFIDSNCQVNLVAPTDSTNNAMPGVLVFTDRRWTSNNSQDIQFYNATVTGDGIWYSPSTGLGMWGTHWSSTNYTSLVTASLYAGPGSSITLGANFSSVSTRNPYRAYGGLVD